jgi:hypothetical protein
LAPIKVQALESPLKLAVVKNVVRRAEAIVLVIVLVLFELIEPRVLIVFTPFVSVVQHERQRFRLARIGGGQVGRAVASGARPKSAADPSFSLACAEARRGLENRLPQPRI